MTRYTFKSLQTEASLYNDYAKEAGLNVTYEIGNAYGHSETYVRTKTNENLTLLESGTPRDCAKAIRLNYNIECRKTKK